MSGAPVRVHIGPAVGLFIGFFLPALMVRKWKEIKEKIYRILALIFTGIIALCFFNSLAIAKASFVSMVIELLPAGTIALSGLLFIHMLSVMAGEKFIKRKVDWDRTPHR
jgi:drug/metabolite transporter (DMT)-like permease